MNIIGFSTIDINCLKNAVLINENDMEFICGGIGFSLDDHSIVIDLLERSGDYYATIPFDLIKDWSIQFNSRTVF